jgi:polygalacturonase
MRKTKFCRIFQSGLQSGIATVGILFATTTFGTPTLPNINTNNVVNITNALYGAVGDGVTDNTTAIQNAINAAAAGGTTNGLSGGTVEIPAGGTYLSGPLTLASQINLQIDSGATLKFLPFSSYPNAWGTPAYPIAGTNLTDLEISGSGTIDGNGLNWWYAGPPNRPYMIYFSRCYRVLIQNVTLQYPPKMHIVFKNGAGNITVQGITINTPPSPNTDGIDLIGTNCLVQNCSISDGDDNIALGSSGSSAVSSDILITNCTFGIGHGVSIGSNTSAGVSNLTVINCTFSNTDYGIRMKSDNNATSSGNGRGGIAQNLSYLNLVMTNLTYGAIVIYSYYNEYGTPIGITPAIAASQSVGSANIPIWRNITISNVTATVASGGMAGIIWGRIEAPVSNITLSHVSITASTTFDVYNAQGVRFTDSQITLPSGNKTFTLYNADITVGNSAPGAPLITFDGLTSTNSLALYQAPASMTATDVFGASPITLDVSTLTISNNLTLPGSSVVNFVLGTNNAKVVTTGNLNLNSTINVAAGNGFGAGTYTLFTYNGSFHGNPALGSRPAGYSYSITNPPGQVQLLVQSPPQSPNGVLAVSVNPPSGSALIANSSQPIFVTVEDATANDIYEVTGATVTGTIPGVVTNTFLDTGNPPGVTAFDGIYSATLQVPASTGPLTMTVVATNANEVGTTNVVYYSVIQPPANDNFTNATKVPTNGASYLANNQFATLESGEPKHDGDQNVAASLWWTWKPSTSTNVFIDTVGSDIDAILAVYTGNALTNLQQVVATNGSLAQYEPAQVSFNAQAGTTYYIVVASVNSSSVGSLNLHITPGGQPDTVAPIVLVTNLLSGLTVESPIINVAGTAYDPMPNASGVSQVFVAVNGSLLPAVIGTTNWMTLVSLHPNMNIIQVGAVDEAGNFSSPVTVEVNYLVSYPTNDFFVHAIQLSGNSGNVLATNITATREVGEPYITGNPGGHSLWWYFVPPTNGVLTLQTTNNTFDTLLGLYTGTNVANLTLVADNDDAFEGAPGGFSELIQAVRTGQTNYIAVDGYDGESGTFSLIYSFVPATVYQLMVSNSPGGTVQLETTNGLGGVTVLPGESGDFASNSIVALVAVLNDAGFQFDTWNGDPLLTNNLLTVVMESDTNVTANFIARVFTDGFESGDLSNLAWTTAGDAPWFVQTNVVCVGQYAARSVVIGDSQSSSLILTNNFTAGIGSFDYKVSSETNWDFLNFYVDNVLLQRWSGEVGWATYTFLLTAGSHTVEWRYVKDPAISEGLDAAFIDDVSLPPTDPSPAILQLQRRTDGEFFVDLAGQNCEEYIVQTSTNLVHWQSISTNFATGGGVIHVLVPPNRTNQMQFYRAIVP